MSSTSSLRGSVSSWLRSRASSARRIAKPANCPLEETFPDESVRIRDRRAKLDTAGEAADVCGLALSGGGIRSATFALGVLQGLARSRSPQGGGADPVTAPNKSLLARFDYLSTVSGGGYIGAFFCSLFVPGRLWWESDEKVAAVDAYKVLQHEPPGRIRSADAYSHEGVRRSATAWLRENGRYLTPVGAGDLIYVLALAVRNWFAVQYVLGTFLAASFAVLLLGRFGFASLSGQGAFDHYRSFEHLLLAQAPCTQSGLCFWPSPIFAVPVVVIALWLVPLGIAYWLTHPGRGEDDNAPPHVGSAAAFCALAIAAVSFAIAYLASAYPDGAHGLHVRLPLAAGALAALGFAFHAVTVFRAATVSAHRVVMTRWLATGFKLFLAVLVVAIVDSLGQSLYLTWTRRGSGALVSPAAFVAAAVWLFRQLARLADRGGIPEALKKIPIGLLAGIAGVSLFLVIASLWGLLFQALIWRGAAPAAQIFDGSGASRQLLSMDAALLGICAAVFVLLAFVSGRFTSFLNLSTLQSFYSARLTRAYLGGSNGARYDPGTSARRRKDLSAAEPVAGDQLDRDRYYRSLAPLHVINVTVNQTIDPAEQLVQRDRKGKPMAVLPTGFSIDRTHYDFRHAVNTSVGSGLGSQKLTVGQWIGTSGAAFTTGLGRSTSLGTSIALGLANVRLGTWWSSGHGRDSSRWLERAFKWLFKTQVFLFYELMAKFHGLRREWQYLSDGGHFENTGLYELLRPGRNVRFAVVCDDGCDPGYGFGDLANLVRLARIDHRLQIEVDEAIAEEPGLREVFATPKDFARAPEGARRPIDDKCAMLLNVYDAADERPRTSPRCRIVLLKPNLLACAPVDVLEYAATHPAFPQESTVDQFFDEAQWESYRCLGLRIARRVFGESPDGNGDALWQYLARPALVPETGGAAGARRDTPDGVSA